MKTIKAADLFCGAGGSSTGLKRVADALGVRLDLTAINHWPLAVQTHAANHPEARHVCESLDSIDPRKVTGGSLDLLWASPECTHHSNARGGVPMSDQSRATAWCVVRWAEALRPKFVIIENVPELLSWGPLNAKGRPLASRKGELFQAWVCALKNAGYTVEWRVMNSADHGAATSRKRLFVVCRFDGGARGRGPIAWPMPTHAPAGTSPLFGDLAPWRGAREIIDWQERGSSIFRRKKDLAPRTMERIAAGARKFWGIDLPELPTETQRSEYDRLKWQAREIERALREAGCPAMPLEQGVRWLANRDFAAPLPPCVWREFNGGFSAESTCIDKETGRPHVEGARDVSRWAGCPYCLKPLTVER